MYSLKARRSDASPNRMSLDKHSSLTERPGGHGRVEDWRHGSVGSAYPLLPVSFGSASLADDPAGDGAKPEGTGCRSCDLVICNEAPGSGSKPSRQWRGSTPITSVVPDSVRKAVVTVGVKPG